MPFLDFIKKAAPYLKYILFGGAVITLLFLWHSKSGQLSKLDQEYQLYKRQMSGQLDDKEKALEEANAKLGIAQSKFQSQDDLLRQYSAEKIKTSAELEAFKRQYNLLLKEYNVTYAQLQEVMKNKNSTVVTSNDPRESTDPKPDAQFDHLINPQKEKLSYNWKSGDGRFELSDPDIFVSSTTKTFTLNQSFRVTGEVYRQKVGFLKTQRLTLEELVVSGKNKDGSPKYTSVGQAKIVDSHFNYTEDPPTPFYPHKGYFGIWPTISANLGFNNGLHYHFVVGAGLDWVNYKGLGSGVNIYIDTTTIQNSAFGLDLSYRPTILGHQLNLGLSAGIATEFINPFKTYTVLGGIKFWVW